MLTLGWDKSFSRAEFPFTKYSKMISSDSDKCRCLLGVGKLSLGCLSFLKHLVCSLLWSKTPRGFHGRHEHVEIASCWESSQGNEKALCEKNARKKSPKCFKTLYFFIFEGSAFLREDLLRWCFESYYMIKYQFWKLKWSFQGAWEVFLNRCVGVLFAGGLVLWRHVLNWFKVKRSNTFKSSAIFFSGQLCLEKYEST